MSSENNNSNENTIIKEDGSLNLFSIGDKIYVPYINPAINTYKVLEGEVIGFVSNDSPEGALVLSYQLKVEGEDKPMLVNVVATVSEDKQKVSDYLNEFISSMISELEGYQSKINEQQETNIKHVEALKKAQADLA